MPKNTDYQNFFQPQPRSNFFVTMKGKSATSRVNTANTMNNTFLDKDKSSHPQGVFHNKRAQLCTQNQVHRARQPLPFLAPSVKT